MHNSQAQHLFKRIEIVVTMEQRMSLADAEGRYQAINSLAHGETLAPKASKISRCSDGEIRAACLKNL